MVVTRRTVAKRSDKDVRSTAKPSSIPSSNLMFKFMDNFVFLGVIGAILIHFIYAYAFVESNVLDVPIIDISPLMERWRLMKSEHSKDDKQLLLDCERVAVDIARASKSHGIFRISGHGATIGDFEESHGAMKTLFLNTTQEEKNSMQIEPGGFTRGFVSIGGESGSHRLEVKEAFSYGYNWSDVRKTSNNLQGPNKWPKAFSSGKRDAGYNSRRKLDGMYTSLIHISEALVQGYSLAMNEDIDYLRKYCSMDKDRRDSAVHNGKTISLLRLFHYFPYNSYESDSKQERIGSSPHTDWGFLTLIMEFGVGGLQLFNQQTSKWYDIAPAPGTIIVNGGDYLSLLTNGAFVSPLHRVVTAKEERMSAVLFYYPSYDAIIPFHGNINQHHSVLADQRQDTIVATEQVSSMQEKLASMSFGQYISEKWAQVFRKKGGKEY